MTWKTLLALAITAAPVLAGNSSGGGGSAVVCRDANHKVTAVDLLDLFEGDLTGTVIRSDAPVKDQLSAISKRLSVLLYDAEGYEKIRQQVQKRMHRLPAGVHLDLLNDALPIIHKEGCQLEQMARYTEWGDLLVDGELADFLDHKPKGNTDLAAVVVHESLYAFIRAKKTATDSREARRLVAKLFEQPSDTSDGELYSLLNQTQPVPADLLRLREDYAPNEAKLAFAFGPQIDRNGVVHTETGFVKTQFELSGYDVKTKRTWALPKGTCESSTGTSIGIFFPCTDQDGHWLDLDINELLEDGKLLRLDAKPLDPPRLYLDVLFDYTPGGFEKLQLGSNSPYRTTWYLKLWQK